MWGAILHEADNWRVVEPREIGVLDRIGGGDGFVGGIGGGFQPGNSKPIGWPKSLKRCISFVFMGAILASAPGPSEGTLRRGEREKLASTIRIRRMRQ
jgi:hypothetical protein